MAATYVESLTNPRDSLPNNFSLLAREQDFVSVFQLNWEALMRIMGISRPIRKTLGTRLKSYQTTVELESGNVEPGCVIPYSKVVATEKTMADVVFQKFAKTVTIEDVSTHGAERAVEKTDEAFRNKIQNDILMDFYALLNTGSLTGAETTWQMALAMAKGNVINKFQNMSRSVTDVIGFVNTMDAYRYLGAQNMSTQTNFGIEYLKNFMGYSTLFLMPDKFIASGTVIACPTENIDLYYVDPSDTDFSRIGLQYTTVGETNLIGFHAQGNYSTAVGETYAIVGMTLWAEYLDGIAVINVGYESFTEVVSPTGNPAEKKYYEKDASNNYFRTIDETVDNAKTYYSRTVTENP